MEELEIKERIEVIQITELQKLARIPKKKKKNSDDLQRLAVTRYFGLEDSNVCKIIMPWNTGK